MDIRRAYVLVDELAVDVVVANIELGVVESLSSGSMPAMP